MKLVDLDNPVRSGWFPEQGYRLDPGPYISETFKARAFLASIPRTDALADVSERIFHAGRGGRDYTFDREHGVPFLGSADIFEADLSAAPLIVKGSAYDNLEAKLRPGWTLITCSGMSAGRVTYARIEMDGYACSQDVMRVVPNLEKIPGGYLYTFLASPLGISMIKGRIYGTSVKHIEPSHIADLPVPRVGAETEQQIDALIQEAMQLRHQFQTGVVAATRDLFESAGLEDLLDLRWHDQPRDIDFSVTGLSATSLRALNYSPRARKIFDQLMSVPYRTLGEICRGGILRTGARFKRTDANPIGGVRLVGQRQAFWMRPSGRWINPDLAPSDIRLKDETVLVAAHGTLGDSEVFGRSIFVTGNWTKHAYSQDFLRVGSGSPEFSGAYLFAFFRSEAAFRILRSMSTGGKQQDYHTSLLGSVPVPECRFADRQRIEESVRTAYRLREEADLKEDRALALLDEAVREAAG